MAGLSPPRPLAAEDDRTGFDCGRESLNQWFHRHAWNNQALNASRTSIVCDADTGQIVGYVALSAAQIERGHLAKSQQRNRPDPLPAILLGQLAVDRRFQGRGHARSLLQFALRTAVRLAGEIGCFAVVTHPLDDGVRAFYEQFGFETLPFDPRHSMAVRILDLERAGFGAAEDTGR
jgi:predicted N-acetyltransferase YhbS